MKPVRYEPPSVPGHGCWNVSISKFSNSNRCRDLDAKSNSMHATDTSSVLNEIRALILDERQVCTFKFVAKKLHIPYDLSKQLLFQYQQREVRVVVKSNGIHSMVSSLDQCCRPTPHDGTTNLRGTTYQVMSSHCHPINPTQSDAVDASFLLSGLSKDGKARIVKVVDAAKLDESKASFSRIDSLHVYSLGPKGVQTPENLVEVDLAQNREALGTMMNADYASLGRVSLANAPKRHGTGAGQRMPDKSPPKSQTLKVGGSKPATDIRKSMGVEGGREKPEEETEHKRKASTSTGPKPEVKKKRAQMIDSDSDDGDLGVDGTAKVTTYINDKGEEVTEIKPVAVKAKGCPAANRQEAGKGALRAAVNEKKGGKQKGIMGFFKPKQ